jgi:hypothetical protein
MLSGAIASPLTGSTTQALAANRGAGTYELHASILPVAGTAPTATLAVDASSENGYYVGMQITFTTGSTVRNGIVTGYNGATKVVTYLGITPATVIPINTLYKIEIVDVPTTGKASAGAPGTITLQSDDSSDAVKAYQAPAIDNFFVGFVITITGGKGSGQSRRITAYTSGREASVDPIWGTGAEPDGTSTYVLHNPNVRGRCSSQNQIQAFGSGNCKGRATTAEGAMASCSFKFPYLKYPSLCPDDTEYTTTLKDMYTDESYGPVRAKLQRKIFHADGLYSSLDKMHKMVEGVTRVIHPNPSKQDTTTATGALPAKITSIEIEDAVALCGISVDGDLVSSAAPALLSAERMFASF